MCRSMFSESLVICHFDVLIFSPLILNTHDYKFYNIYAKTGLKSIAS